MATEEIFTNETVQGRSYRLPRTLTLNGNNTFRLPPGTILDVRPGTFLYSGTLLDNAPNRSLVMGTTWAAPDTVAVDPTDQYLVVLASPGAALTDTEQGVILGSSTAVMGPEAIRTFIAASSNTTIQNSRNSAIIASSSATIDVGRDEDPGADYDNVIIGSASGSNITGTRIYVNGIYSCSNSSVVNSIVLPSTRATTRCGWSWSDDCAADGNIGNIFNSGGIFSANCSVGPGLDTSVLRSFIAGSLSSNISGSSQDVAIIGSTTCTSASSVRACLLGSNACDITGSTESGVINSDNCDIITGDQCITIASELCTTTSCAETVILASASCFPSNTTRTLIAASNDVNMSTGSGNSILACSGPITLNANVNRAFIAASGQNVTYGATITPSDFTGRWFCLGGSNVSCIGTAPGYNSGVLAADGITVTSSFPFGVFNPRMVQTLVAASGNCSIDMGPDEGVNKRVTASGMLGCEVVDWTTTLANREIRNVGCVGTHNTTIEGGIHSGTIGITGATMAGSQESVIAASSGANMSASFQCFAGGVTPSCAGRTNCFVWGNGAPTADNQFVLGAGVNLILQGGTVSATGGFLKNQITQNGGGITITTAYTYYELENGATLTLPLASTFGLNYPLNSAPTFFIDSEPSALPITINTTAPDALNNKTGWTSHTLRPTGDRIQITLRNSATPHWHVMTPIEYRSYASTNVADNFGLTPPQSDANQLPIAASRAAHEALGAASYWTFDNLTTNGTVLSLATPGVQTNFTAGHEIRYQYSITGGAGAGNYLIRTDVINTTTGVPVPGSYAEQGGDNSTAGSMHVTVICEGVGESGVNNYQLRMSQDTTLSITANASITRASISFASTA